MKKIDHLINSAYIVEIRKLKYAKQDITKCTSSQMHARFGTKTSLCSSGQTVHEKSETKYTLYFFVRPTARITMLQKKRRQVDDDIERKRD